ncbi:BFH_HP2_G0045680.mRNA.1.CDS.1 [Saccharomyces cerevisiae]|nr:BFH_HP2_G0045680.mRNA.1.CDS.1 [Saccharomyces cerevisiae]CAI6739334.1 BFH_HP2_G0045680.mRNA.1.CDS.1 [Saccharomyces cerevisiae]CAI6752074.1 BFH_HP1_G0046090.mRNA.1.CDS.1 [Saccharomyces cerevisiae]
MVKKNFIPSISLVRRDLPTLVTTTTSSTALPKPTSSVVSETSSKSLPSLTSSAFSTSSGATSSSSLIVASITPPSTAGNPFI